MKKSTALRASALIATGGVVGFLSSAVLHGPSGIVETRASAEEKPTGAIEVTNAPSVPSTNNGLLPDQSHAMVDVGYHFANLWFAADKENWPWRNTILRRPDPIWGGPFAFTRCERREQDRWTSKASCRR